MSTVFVGIRCRNRYDESLSNIVKLTCFGFLFLRLRYEFNAVILSIVVAGGEVFTTSFDDTSTNGEFDGASTAGESATGKAKRTTEPHS